MIYPRGKGWYIWNLIDADLKNFDLDWMVNRLKELGCNWVAVKIADGVMPFNRKAIHDKEGNVVGWDDTILTQFTSVCREAGIDVWGWQYIYCTYQPANEAKIAVERCKKFGMTGFLLDPEAEAKLASRENTAIYCNSLRSGLGKDYPIGLSTSRFPTLHPELKWDIWLSISDFHIPQMYWMNADNPVEQLARSYKELIALKNMPYFPAGALYHQDGWQPTRQQVIDFGNAAEEFGAMLMWEWANAERYNMADWFKELPGFEISPPEPPEPEPMYYKTIYSFTWTYPAYNAPRATNLIAKAGTVFMVIEVINGRAHLLDQNGNNKGWCGLDALVETDPPVVPPPPPVFQPYSAKTKTGLWVYPVCPDATTKASGHINVGVTVVVMEIIGQFARFRQSDSAGVSGWVYLSGLAKI